MEITDFVIGILLFLLILAGVVISENEKPPVCLIETTVKSIDSIQFRDAFITLADGTKENVYQATLKPGDKFCKEWKKN